MSATMKNIFSDLDAALSFDYDQLSEYDPEIALLAVHQAVRALRGAEERVLHTRMRIIRAVRLLGLWKLDRDEEVGQPFASLDRWVKVTWGEGFRYAKEAWQTEEALADVPMEALAQITGANLKVLADKGLSSNLRTAPDVIEAAKCRTKDNFLEYLNNQHHQHIPKPTLMPKEDIDEFEAAIEMARVCEHCTSRAEAIKAVSVSYIQDHAVEFERLRETA
jgi:hypothetical protein